jgi:hypothetical protein
MKRVFFDICLFLSILILPWWITALLAFAGIFIFAQFYEFLGAGAMMYALYATAGTRIISSPLWFGVMLILIFAIIQISRRYIILYKNEI